jgi:hypothetical protein
MAVRQPPHDSRHAEDAEFSSTMGSNIYGMLVIAAAAAAGLAAIADHDSRPAEMCRMQQRRCSTVLLPLLVAMTQFVMTGAMGGDVATGAVCAGMCWCAHVWGADSSSSRRPWFGFTDQLARVLRCKECWERGMWCHACSRLCVAYAAVQRGTVLACLQ